MISMQCLDEGVDYKDEPISRAMEVHVGDKFVFISTSDPPINLHLHRKVVTVSDVSGRGGLAVREDGDNHHFIRACFHEIIYEEVDMSDFDAVFE